MTKHFLALCEQRGSQRFALRLVAVGPSGGIAGLPASDDWTAWDGDEMRPLADHLECMRVEEIPEMTTARSLVAEGPIVDGQENGHWVIRDADGEVGEGRFGDRSCRRGDVYESTME